jgi:hypothetical protein
MKLRTHEGVILIRETTQDREVRMTGECKTIEQQVFGFTLAPQRRKGMGAPNQLFFAEVCAVGRPHEGNAAEHEQLKPGDIIACDSSDTAIGALIQCTEYLTIPSERVVLRWDPVTNAITPIGPHLFTHALSADEHRQLSGYTIHLPDSTMIDGQLVTRDEDDIRVVYEWIDAMGGGTLERKVIEERLEFSPEVTYRSELRAEPIEQQVGHIGVFEPAWSMRYYRDDRWNRIARTEGVLLTVEL